MSSQLVCERWKSRGYLVMAFLCMCLNSLSTLGLPNTSTDMGTLGCFLLQVLGFVVIGTPLVYMEMIIGQFTTRDCIDIWKARPCLSHIGYAQVLWQILMLIANHILTCFILHYQLIMFERPVPFYDCSLHPAQRCNILLTNRTVNEDCSKVDKVEPYCDNLYKTFPEHLYWRITLLSTQVSHISWHVCLSSAIICVFIFLACFKRKRSLQWCLYFFTIYPLIGYLIIMTGSMIQKGLVEKYEDALDISFKVFMHKARWSHVVPQVSMSLNVGAGLAVTLSSTAGFRSPTHSNTSVVIVVATAFTMLAGLTSAMIFCPYAYENDIRVYVFMKNPLTFVFEKIPRLFDAFNDKYVWLFLFFSSNLVLCVGYDAIVFFLIMQLATNRVIVIRKYPGLTTFIGVSILFCITLPCMGNLGANVVVSSIQRFTILMLSLLTGLEGIVFVIWYGTNRFSEDVHFMEGVRPNFIKKLAWLIAVATTMWFFCGEVLYQIKLTRSRSNDIFGWSLFCCTLAFIFLGLAVKLAMAAREGNVRAALALDASWGPRNELLRRSREMFSAQAMTKEYVYRQNQLQAGIVARQLSANIRHPVDISERR